jgi:ABC-2 type transport system permease protein
MIPIVLGFVVMATGIGMLLSALYVRFRDVQPIWDVIVQALFYASPIMYVASNYKQLEHAALQNPAAMLLTQMGHAFIHAAPVLSEDPKHAGWFFLDQKLPSAAHAAGGPAHLIIPLLLIPAVFALGLWVFTREAPRVAENL